MKKRILSVLLTLLLVASIVPAAAFAAETAAEELVYTAIEGKYGANADEKYDKLFDGNISGDSATKWCVVWFDSDETYVIFKVSDSVKVIGYTLVPAYDTVSYPDRNPNSWELYCSEEFDENFNSGMCDLSWQLIDSVEDDEILSTESSTPASYKVEANQRYCEYYMLKITGVRSGSEMQLGGFSLQYEKCEHNFNVTTTPADCYNPAYETKVCQGDCGKTVTSVVSDSAPLTHVVGDDGCCEKCGAINPQEVGGFIVSGSADGSDYSYEDGVLSVLTDTALIISNKNFDTATTDRIFVKKDVSANITLAGVKIDASATDYVAAFKIADSSNGSVTVTLAESSKNTLVSGYDCAGLEKNGTLGELTINGNGQLWAESGEDGAGIGGSNGYDSENITITGTTVTAISACDGAGIGGGDSGDGRNITITDSVVKALSKGGYGAGIGGGEDGGNGENITITGSNVVARGNEDGAGIGGGDVGGNGVNITITDSTISASSGDGGAGIGGGDEGGGCKDITITDSTVLAISEDGGAGIGSGEDGGIGQYITITNSTVTAISEEDGAGIGGGDGDEGIGDGQYITITNSTVTATSGDDGAGIGGGYYGKGRNIIITNSTVTATSGDDGAGIGGGYKDYGRNITITNSTVTATSECYGAGIGGGYKDYGRNITITNSTVTATSEDDGAGIGGGYDGDGRNITITNSTVTATSEADGAGIGGGYDGDGRNITITNSTVTATSEADGAGIGGGYGGSAGDIKFVGSSVHESSLGCTPTDGTNNLYLFTISNPESRFIMIDGKVYKPCNHKAIEEKDNTNLYAYVTGEDHKVRIGFEEYTYTFDSETENFAKSDDFKTILPDSYSLLEVSATDSKEELVYGEDYIYENNVLTVLSEKGITVKNSSDVKIGSDTVFVAKDVSANITLSGVGIDTSKLDGLSAFKIADDSTGDVTVTLEGYNYLKSSEGCAAVEKNGKDGTLTIKGEGSLTAIGGSNAAGIGCGQNSCCANITLSGVTVTAVGGANAAALGGGNNSSAEKIAISGGSVKAVKGENAPNEIGGGLNKAAVIPTDANGENVYLLTLANAEDESLVIDGKAYKPNVHKTIDEAFNSFETDENLYVYLTGEHHIVKLGDNTSHYIFENGSLKEASFEYESTKSKHWKAYSCCPDKKIDEQAHEIVKGKCETCGYEEIYTVTFTDGKNGEFFEEESYTVKYGDKMPSLKADLSEIKSWKLNGWDKTVAKTVTGNVTYTAKWQSKGANTLRLNGNGDKISNESTISDSYTPLTSISAKANPFKKTGYCFNAWNTQSDGNGEWYRVGETVNFEAEHNAEIFTLYAIWTANYYTVSFDANGGEGTMQDMSARYDSELSLDENDFSKAGSKFVGWNTKSDGTGESFADQETVKNLTTLNKEKVTLYAQWSDINAPVISGVEDGKTYCSSQTVTVTDESIDYVTVNGNKVDLDANGQFTIEPAEGDLVIKAADKSGNTTEVTVKVNDGHDYKHGNCTVCGEENTNESYFVKLLRSVWGFIVDIIVAVITFIKSIFRF